MANLINESEIRSTWAPIIESATGINDAEKLAWMSTYCHNHKLYEDASFMSLDPSMNLAGMGATTLPQNITNGVSSVNGSGDKSPSLLPLAMQVAAQTIGLDLVPVVPMAGPMGLLSYLDFVYEGGRIDNTVTPTYVKAYTEQKDAEGIVTGTVSAPAVKANTASAANVYAEALTSKSRIDGETIYEILPAGEAYVDADSTRTVADLFTPAAAVGSGSSAVKVELVKGLEDHIRGFAGDGADDEGYSQPFSREKGERTPDKLMGLSLFSKSVAAETFQVAAAVTREQVQDLKQFGVDAVAQVEAVLTNELTQSINQYILGRLRSLGSKNVTLSNTGFDLTLPTVQAANGGETVPSLHRQILTQVLAAANFIANRGRRGAGNFAVVGAQLATVLQSISGFVANPMANTFAQAAGAIYPLGSVAGINVYTDPTLAWGDHNITVGRKGDGNGPGVVFMPYLMAESVQTIAEGTMAPKVAVKSRFALVDAGFHPETQYVTFEVKGDWDSILNLV